MRFVYLGNLCLLPLQRLVLFGRLGPVYVAAWYRARYRALLKAGGSTAVACLYGNPGVSGALEGMLVGRAGVLEGGRVVVFGDGRLRRARQVPEDLLLVIPAGELDVVVVGVVQAEQRLADALVV